MFGRIILCASRQISTRLTRQLVEVTPAADQEIARLLQNAPGHPIGMRLRLNRRGCSGVGFKLDIVYEQTSDEVVRLDGSATHLFIEPSALLSVVGTKMDFISNKLERKFTFDNPNALGLCGCGESFNLKQ